MNGEGMIKKICLSALRVLALLLTGCGYGQAATAAVSETTTPEPETTEVTQTAGRMDLSAMSTTMAMAQLTAMQNEPESYLGQTIKMRGTFAVGY